MLLRVNDFRDFSLSATNDDFGAVDDVYFDSTGSWEVRFIVGDTRPWFFGGKVLLSPELIKRLTIDEQLVDLDATKEQIKDSPKHDERKPISRQYESTLLNHYGLRHYWITPTTPPGGMHPFPVAGPIAPVGGEAVPPEEQEAIAREFRRPEEDYHLQSSKDLTSYSVYASDEKIGKISDIVFDSQSWQVSFIEIDTAGIMEQDRHFLPVQAFKSFDELEERAYVPVDLNKIESSPRSEQLTEEYRARLNKYYGL